MHPSWHGTEEEKAAMFAPPLSARGGSSCPCHTISKTNCAPGSLSKAGSTEVSRLSCRQHAINLGSDFRAVEAHLVRNSTLYIKSSEGQSRAHMPSKNLGKISISASK